MNSLSAFTLVCLCSFSFSQCQSAPEPQGPRAFHASESEQVDGSQSKGPESKRPEIDLDQVKNFAPALRSMAAKLLDRQHDSLLHKTDLVTIRVLSFGKSRMRAGIEGLTVKARILSASSLTLMPVGHVVAFHYHSSDHLESEGEHWTASRTPPEDLKVGEVRDVVVDQIMFEHSFIRLASRPFTWVEPAKVGFDWPLAQKYLRVSEHSVIRGRVASVKPRPIPKGGRGHGLPGDDFLELEGLEVMWSDGYWASGERVILVNSVKGDPGGVIPLPASDLSLVGVKPGQLLTLVVKHFGHPFAAAVIHGIRQ